MNIIKCMLASLLGSLLVSATAMSCAEVNQPIPVDPHPGYPCGYTWHSCGQKLCCPNGSDCGGTPWCAPGVCCPTGGSSYEARPNTKMKGEEELRGQ